jgi:hypothetical protein
LSGLSLFKLIQPKNSATFASNSEKMKHALTTFFLLAFSERILAQNEIGPEGHKLVWILIVAVALAAIFLFGTFKISGFVKKPLFKKKKVTVELMKDRLYYPDTLELTITNTGNTDVDIDTPLLVFSSIWLKRKFKLKGTQNNWFYPLYLMKGQSHTLNIDLNRFYGFDKTLKRLPKVKVIVSEAKGKKLGSRQVLLRKTLFNL